MEQYDDKDRAPRVLGCVHTFCAKCLQALREAADGEHLNCPTCGTPTPLLPDSDSTQFLRNFALQGVVDAHQRSDPSHQNYEAGLVCESAKAERHCVDCAQFFCGPCATVHAKLKIAKDHRVVTVEEFQSKQTLGFQLPSYCSEHLPENMLHELTLVCKTCDNQPICRDCTVKLHKDHDYDFMDQVAGKAL
jgi:hypothetical protein